MEHPRKSNLNKHIKETEQVLLPRPNCQMRLEDMVVKEQISMQNITTAGNTILTEETSESEKDEPNEVNKIKCPLGE